MNNTNLVIFHCQVMTRTLQMSYLHEVPSKHRLPYVYVVVTAAEIGTA